LVDDDIELLLVYEQLLGLHGYRVSTAQNGVAALKLMRTCPVDAILCDLDMPELSGDLFYVEVSLAWPQLLKRFIFVTGHAEDSVYQHFLQTSGAIVLPKPVPVNRLLAKLREVLEPEPVATSQGR
jgi:CheY-like chemotaxis protein